MEKRRKQGMKEAKEEDIEGSEESMKKDEGKGRRKYGGRRETRRMCGEKLTY